MLVLVLVLVLAPVAWTAAARLLMQAGRGGEGEGGFASPDHYLLQHSEMLTGHAHV